MVKPVIAVDFDGALMKHRPFEKAHIGWFKFMSILLKDKSINRYSRLENYFPKVHLVMKRYLGKVSEKARTEFARRLYAVATIAETKKNDLVADFARYLRLLKKKYRLALITSAPELAVEPILQKVGCSDLFDIIYKSPMAKQPNKKELFKQFIKKYKRPLFYIGNGDEDILTCRKLGIKTISVNWVSKGKYKGNYNINSVKKLKKIIM